MSGGIDKDAKGLGMPWEEGFHYSQGVKVGDTIYVAGQINTDAEGNLVGAGDMEAQLRAAYANVAKVLEAYGASLANVVDDIVFVTDIDAAMVAVPVVRHDVFAGVTPGTTMTVEISRLAFPETLVEVKCIARV